MYAFSPLESRLPFMILTENFYYSTGERLMMNHFLHLLFPLPNHPDLIRPSRCIRAWLILNSIANGGLQESAMSSVANMYNNRYSKTNS